jgi:DHA2 family multidrug resistance protein
MTEAAALAGAAPRGISPWVVAPVVAMATFMEVLDTVIVNVSLQHISGDLGASQDEATWVLTSYLVTNAIILPVAGWLASVIGRKRCFIGCIAGFTASSLLCGLAPSLGLLILFRAIQGFTGGGLQPLSQSILADSFPREKQGMAFAMFGIAVIFAPAIGPTLGGWLTDQASWRWVFLVNVPVGLVLLPLVGLVVRDPKQMEDARKARAGKPLKIDYLGFGMLAIGFGFLQVVLDKGQQDDWFASPTILFMSIASLVSLIGFVIWELGRDDPIVDIRLLANRNFAVANILMFVVGFMLLGSTVLLPVEVQTLFGYSATQAGLVLTPGGFLVMALMPLIARLIMVVDVRWIITYGMVISAVSLLHFANFNLDTDYSHFMWGRVLQASGLGCLFIPINSLAYVGIAREKSSNAAAIINVSRNIGSSVGISVAITVLTRQAQVSQSTLIAHATNLDSSYHAMIGQLTHVFRIAGEGAAAAQAAATGQIYRIILDQAQISAVNHDYRILAVVFVALLPLIALLRPARGPAPGGAH